MPLTVSPPSLHINICTILAQKVLNIIHESNLAVRLFTFQLHSVLQSQEIRRRIAHSKLENIFENNIHTNFVAHNSD